MEPIPSVFLDLFVKKDFRGRFDHEWKKKRAKLQSRICHSADEIFRPETRFEHGEFDYESAPFRDDEEVLFLETTTVKRMKFAEAKRYLDTGDGTLIISTDGTKFIAETESEQGYPYKTYFGKS